MKKLTFLPILLLFFFCKPKETQPVYLEGNAFGTTFHIQFYENEQFNYREGVDSVIDAVNHSVSTYIPESDISKINRGDSTLVVDSIFKEVFEISETV